MTTQATALRLDGWNVVHGVRRLRRVLPALLTVFIAALLIQPPVAGAPSTSVKADPVLSAQVAAHPTQDFSVIVRETAPSSADAETLVRQLGGHVTRELRLIGGFAAVVPGSAVSKLASSALVWRVWGDAPIRVASTNLSRYDTYGANSVWRDAILYGKVVGKYDGTGVGVALVDTGVVPVADLVNRVTHVVDFTPDGDGLDHYGHGTHMAGIIVGDGTASNGQYMGVAPGANLISLKVASADGSTDVSVIIAALQWAVTHRAQYNIRVLNLSFGTDSTQPYSIDPLDYAVEQTWFSGIFVAVAAGNAGPGAGTITKPGDDPFVVTVGADDTAGTAFVSDDVVAPFSSQGPTQDGVAKPDLLAPGISIVSDRDPGSFVDVNHPAAQVGDSYFKGTGTSQATAVVSGVAALMFQANPNLTPDLAKAALLKTASRLSYTQVGAGAGLVSAAGAVQAATSLGLKNPNFGILPSTGLGSLEQSRGSLHLYVSQCDSTGPCQPVVLTGEYDALGNKWATALGSNGWGDGSWVGNKWSSYTFEGNKWSGNSWSEGSWTGNKWSGVSWGDASWSGNKWSGTCWIANSWSGNSWSANSWSGNSWSGNSWSGNSWSGNSWSGNSWS
jgi:serine protease AprX